MNQQLYHSPSSNSQQKQLSSPLTKRLTTFPSNHQEIQIQSKSIKLAINQPISPLSSLDNPLNSKSTIKLLNFYKNYNIFKEMGFLLESQNQFNKKTEIFQRFRIDKYYQINASKFQAKIFLYKSETITYSQEDMTAMKQLYEEEIIALRATINSHVSVNHDYKLQNDKLKEKTNSLQGKNNQLQDQNSLLQGQNKELEGQYNVLQAKYNDSQNKNNSLTSEKDQLVREQRKFIIQSTENIKSLDVKVREQNGIIQQFEQQKYQMREHLKKMVEINDSGLEDPIKKQGSIDRQKSTLNTPSRFKGNKYAN